MMQYKSFKALKPFHSIKGELVRVGQIIEIDDLPDQAVRIDGKLVILTRPDLVDRFIERRVIEGSEFGNKRLEKQIKDSAHIFATSIGEVNASESADVSKQVPESRNVKRFKSLNRARRNDG